MSIKGFIRAVGKAAFYLIIYFIWQVIVVNWVSIGATFAISSQYGPVEDQSEYLAMLDEITARVYDIIDAYSLHITLAAGVLTILSFIIIFKFRRKKPLAEMGFSRIKLSQVPILILFGIALNMFISVLLSFIPFPASWVDSYNATTEIILESSFLITAMTTLICAPLVEEITFRGLVYSRLCKGMPMLAAMLISSWLFGVIHGNMIQMLYASVIGFIICYIRVKYESLTACVLVHFGFNMFSFFSEWFGESDALVIMLIGAVVSIGLFIYISKTNDRKIEFAMTEASNE